MTTSGDDHPDLVSLGTSMQRRLDRVMEAELEAAAVLARRSATLRDRLVEAEDAGGTITLKTRSGERITGVVVAVATDHLELRNGTLATLVAMDQIAMVDL